MQEADLDDQIDKAKAELLRLQNLKYALPTALAEGQTIFKLVFGDTCPLVPKMTRFHKIIKIPESDFRPPETIKLYFQFGDSELFVYYKLFGGHDEWVYSFRWTNATSIEYWTVKDEWDDPPDPNEQHSPEYTLLSAKMETYDVHDFRGLMDDIKAGAPALLKSP